MLDTTEKFLTKHNSVLTEKEIDITKDRMQHLREAIDAKDKDRIRLETEILNDVSRPYAERVMDAALKDAMKGKKVI
jgi:molecular chaperone HscA